MATWKEAKEQRRATVRRFVAVTCKLNKEIAHDLEFRKGSEQHVRLQGRDDTTSLEERKRTLETNGLKRQCLESIILGLFSRFGHDIRVMTVLATSGARVQR